MVSEPFRWFSCHARLPAARSKAIAAVRRARTPAILVRYSMVPRLSLIGLAAAWAAASSFANVSASSVCPIKAVGRGRNQDHGRRDGAQGDARGCADALFVQRHVDAAAHDCDVHFSARNEPQIGVGRASRTRRQLEFKDELVLRE